MVLMRIDTAHVDSLNAPSAADYVSHSKNLLKARTRACGILLKLRDSIGGCHTLLQPRIVRPQSATALWCTRLLSLQRWQLPDKVTRTLIAARVVVQVLLVVRLGRPPLAGGRDLCDDGAVPPLLVGELCDLPGVLLLLRVVEVDGGAVLWAGIGTLAVQGCGVVRAVEELEELAVRDLVWVEDDLCRLGVCTASVDHGG
jgi:hypothetical protein